MFLNKYEYGLIGFEKSNRKNKKYNAILINYNTKQKKIIPFGDLRYQQYKDRTYLNLYSHLNHNDENRRRLYILRHKKDIKNGFYSAGYFSMFYLW
jgi:uncharacterized protein YlbG (UPF0298 family)